MIGWLIALINFAIGLFNISLLKGWLLVHPLDAEYSEAWIKKHRTSTLIIAILSTGGSIVCVLQMLGVVRLPVLVK
ncbi:hypothetical protein [Prosthecobacter sp.]|uniref:hypothetical protein n=1 Tax=Prosthecobacter sp. TaxID=1965333 RepID=UPI00378394B3